MAEPDPGIASLLDRLRDMPSSPSVVAKLTVLMANPRTTANEIAYALSRDPGMVSRILKLVNSARYGFSRRIATVTMAVVIAGFREIRNLALSAFFFNNFVTSSAVNINIDGLWRHSLGVAFFAAAIARRMDAKSAEDAFIHGLLHDIGKFVAIRTDTDQAVRIREMAERDNILFLEAERRSLSYDHAQLGSAAMERWNLPQLSVETVRHHHTPFGAPEPCRVHACIVNLADVMARALLMGDPGDRRMPVLTGDVWRHIGLSWRDMEAVSRQAAGEYVKSGDFFKF
ncbi:MAG: HDOD domain-containing protein [Planctomycetota bacterium]|nr:HDOD domain-containing protein [Planctomycetota bacterium]